MPEIRKVESGKLLCLETTGPFESIHDLYRQIDTFVKERRVPIKGDRLAIFYDAPEGIDRAHAHFAAAVELAGECTGDGEVTVVIQSAAIMACESHQGDYAGLTDAYQRLLSWIHDKGFKIIGPPHEYYISGPPADSATYLTEIQIPVERPGF
ncbi:GyrI-like domain-containing protein [bacterium]|nr:GyrI-like domain-containing protein [bacterium]